jgi:hypothetical protein
VSAVPAQPSGRNTRRGGGHCRCIGGRKALRAWGFEFGHRIGVGSWACRGLANKNKTKSRRTDSGFRIPCRRTGCRTLIPTTMSVLFCTVLAVFFFFFFSSFSLSVLGQNNAICTSYHIRNDMEWMRGSPNFPVSNQVVTDFRWRNIAPPFSDASTSVWQTYPMFPSKQRPVSGCVDVSWPELGVSNRPFMFAFRILLLILSLSGQRLDIEISMVCKFAGPV